jgi:hypothetical protein
MRPCMAMGQAAGTAAAIAVANKTTPAGVYERHLHTLQQTLLKDGCYLLGVRNQDPADLARSATDHCIVLGRSDAGRQSGQRVESRGGRRPQCLAGRWRRSALDRVDVRSIADRERRSHHLRAARGAGPDRSPSHPRRPGKNGTGTGRSTGLAGSSRRRPGASPIFSRRSHHASGPTSVRDTARRGHDGTDSFRLCPARRGVRDPVVSRTASRCRSHPAAERTGIAAAGITSAGSAGHLPGRSGRGGDRVLGRIDVRRQVSGRGILARRGMASMSSCGSMSAWWAFIIASSRSTISGAGPRHCTLRRCRARRGTIPACPAPPLGRS